mgnify:CR=1 FL=1
MILRVKVNKQLDGKANGIIESCQEIISELCSIQEWGDFTWRVSDCEELVGGYSQEMMGLVSWIHFVLLHSQPIP